MSDVEEQDAACAVDRLAHLRSEAKDLGYVLVARDRIVDLHQRVCFSDLELSHFEARTDLKAYVTFRQSQEFAEQIAELGLLKKHEETHREDRLFGPKRHEFGATLLVIRP